MFYNSLYEFYEYDVMYVNKEISVIFHACVSVFRNLMHTMSVF